MIKFEPARTRDGRDVRRASVRHGWEYVLRCIPIAARLTNGDVLRGLILIAIIQANTASLRQSRGDQDHDTIDGVPDDSLRTPVSVYAVAKQLGLPYETVRRHIAGLTEEGRCVRIGDRGGLLVPADVIRGMGQNIFIRDTLDALDNMVDGLNQVGSLQVPKPDYTGQSVMIG